MSLAAVIDTVAARLTAALGAGVTIDDSLPAAGAALPTVTVAVSDADQMLAGVGRIPGAARVGALEVTVEIDLADPVLDIAGESVPLLSADRRTLTVPNGPIVRADGTEGPPFTDADAAIADGDGPYAVVDTAPTGRTVQIHPDVGQLQFGQELPASGTLTIAHRVGQWDVTVTRYGGLLQITTTAETAASTMAISRQVAEELSRESPAFEFLKPVDWGASEPSLLDTTAVHRQVLRHRFAFELETPSLPPGGGMIRTVAIAGHVDDALEEFEVPIPATS